MTSVREPAVAGMFYPDEPERLRGEVERYLAEAPVSSDAPPHAIVAPHAGYPYSGPVAASAYSRIAPLRGRISRVVLLGPSHRVGFEGIALPEAGIFRTPLGDIPVDVEAIERLSDLPQVMVYAAAHAHEHSLEVHLPFLQVVLGEFALVPLVVGDAAPEDVAEVIERLWQDDETLVVVSTDLSHYQDYASANRRDGNTSEAIERLDYGAIGSGDACGRHPLAGLLQVARDRGLRIETVDLRNSGDTAGSRDRVVGYGAYVLH